MQHSQSNVDSKCRAPDDLGEELLDGALCCRVQKWVLMFWWHGMQRLRANHIGLSCKQLLGFKARAARAVHDKIGAKLEDAKGRKAVLVALNHNCNVRIGCLNNEHVLYKVHSCCAAPLHSIHDRIRMFRKCRNYVDLVTKPAAGRQALASMASRNSGWPSV